MEVAEALGDGYQFMLCQNWRLWALNHLGAWGEVRHGLEAALRTAERNASPIAMAGYILQVALLEVEALDFEGARRHSQHTLDLAREARYIPNIYFFLGQITLAKAQLGLRHYPSVLGCLNGITRALEDERVLMDWIFRLPFHQVRCEYWLAEGHRDRAREEATQLCEKAALPPERTYLAIGHGLLAEIASAERRWDEARSELARAIEIVEAAEVPLAAWRVFATAAELYRRQGQTGEAEGYRRRGAHVIDALAASLEETDPLRQSLLNHPLLKVGALGYSVAGGYLSAGNQV